MISQTLGINSQQGLSFETFIIIIIIILLLSFQIYNTILVHCGLLFYNLIHIHKYTRHLYKYTYILNKKKKIEKRGKKLDKK